MNLASVETILWDWNGTLLNDTDHCISCMNELLSHRKLPLLTKEKYLQVFTFPVKKYYSSLGFDFVKEPFEIPAEEFIVYYHQKLSQVPLFEDVIMALGFFHKLGVRQYILSAMEHEALMQCVQERKIISFFTRINGISDNLAHGKTDLAKKMLKQENLTPHRTLLVGDTLHDAEVARHTGMQNVLIARGHQNASRLMTTGNPVYSSLKELTGHFTASFLQK